MYTYKKNNHILFRNPSLPFFANASKNSFFKKPAIQPKEALHKNRIIQTYRPSSATHFGVADSAGLKEDSFDIATDKETKPWIKKVNVELSNTTFRDRKGNDAYKGQLIATYYSNNHALSDIAFPVTAGSVNHKSSEANHLVHRIEGMGYMSSDYSDRDNPYTPNPANRRYNINPNSANMHYAVFYKGAQAIHKGSLLEASHGCLHANNSKLVQLNYHTVKGLTAVIVKYV